MLTSSTWLVGFLFGSVIIEAVSSIKSITQMTDHSDTWFKSDRKRVFVVRLHHDDTLLLTHQMMKVVWNKINLFDGTRTISVI